MKGAYFGKERYFNDADFSRKGEDNIPELKVSTNSMLALLGND